MAERLGQTAATVLRDVRRTWEDHGRRDPFFSVLSDPAKHGGGWSPDEFFASGVAHVDSLMQSLADARIPVPRGGHCLDFGCGVGRLSQALCRYFDRVTGVDVAQSMIRRARAFNHAGDRCAYLVNRRADVAQFDDACFDVVHSCIVLQHMPPEMALAYIREFFRVVTPGGLVVFQLPSEARRADESPGAFALADEDYRASLALAAPLPHFDAGRQATVVVAVENRSHAVWPETTPTGHAGRILVGNHWLSPGGAVRVRDDGRGPLPRAVWPGDRVEIAMVVTPPAPGDVILELDLVQELLCWFADKGSATLRVAATVHDSGSASTVKTPHVTVSPPPPFPSSRISWGASLVDYLLQPFRRPAAPLEMHAVPRDRVEAAIAAVGGVLVRAIEDDACGAGWRSYTYICRRINERPQGAQDPRCNRAT